MDVRQNIVERLFRLNLTDKALEAALQYYLDPPDDTIVIEEDHGVNEQDESAALVLNASVPGDLLTTAQVADKYGYSRAAPYYWAAHHPEVVRRYKLPGDNRARYSEREVMEYLAIYGQPTQKGSGQPTQKVSPKEKRNGKLEPSSSEPMQEMDTVSGAAKRLRIGRTMVNELVRSGKVQSREFNGHIIVSVREIEALGRGQLVLPNMSIFDNNEWLPMRGACDFLGIPYADMHQAISRACDAGSIANRKIGSLRFVNVSDLERWYLSRG